MKIYIIGAPGSGKTTLAKQLSKKYKIAYFELDVLVFDDEHDHKRRTDEAIEKEFKKILKKKNWIVEDVGRTRFQQALEESNRIYYLKTSKFLIFVRIIKRWNRQRKGFKNYNYPPTFGQLWDMLKIANSYFKKEKQKLNKLKKYNKVVRKLKIC